MLVSRWQAPIVPDKNQILKMYEMEGLEPQEETFENGVSIKDQRRPFDIVITVSSGEIKFDITGNQLLLRQGDRIMIPSNTKYSFDIAGNEPGQIILARKLI